MNLTDKTDAILNGLRDEANKAETAIPARTGYALAALATACALLTSPVKAEREEGKAMVRRWKHGNTF